MSTTRLLMLNFKPVDDCLLKKLEEAYGYNVRKLSNSIPGTNVSVSGDARNYPKILKRLLKMTDLYMQ